MGVVNFPKEIQTQRALNMTRIYSILGLVFCCVFRDCIAIRSRAVIIEGHDLIVKTFKYSDSSFKQHSLRAVKTGVCRL